ncbi:hypothetical protein ACFSKL_14875 [Belliella marina]|uniref:Uncharacterized protein n=1 Tax=Belliella marina TaxID=1644146 RepID=A0ABW4VPS8_9BACT
MATGVKADIHNKIFQSNTVKKVISNLGWPLLYPIFPKGLSPDIFTLLVLFHRRFVLPFMKKIIAQPKLCFVQCEISSKLEFEKNKYGFENIGY